MFNIYIEIEEGIIGIYNTLHDSAATISKKLYVKFPDKSDDDFTKSLIKQNILLDEELDERKYFNYYINKLKYSPQKISFTILLTTDCNFTCQYCFEGVNQRKYYMDKKKAENTAQYVITQLNSHPSVKKAIIGFYGGEPLLNYDALDIICRTLVASQNIRNKCEFTITTNLYLLNDNYIKLLKKYNFLNVQVAIDGPEYLHNSRRKTKGGKGTFSTILNNIEKLVKNKISTIVILNYDLGNYTYLDELTDVIKEKLPIENLSFYLNPITKSLYNQKCYTNFINKESESEIFLQLYKLLRKKKIPIEVFGQRDMVCMATSDVSSVIDPNGNLFKCGLTIHANKYKIGTIYDDIYSDLNYDLLLTEHWRKCLIEACKYLPICGGGCRGMALLDNSDFHSVYCEKEYYYEKTFNAILKDHLNDLLNVTN